MKQLLAAAMAIVTLGCAGCTRGDEAARVLANQGYTQIQLTGWRPFACSDDDTFHTGFKARTMSGTTVTGAVCSGWLKGATVRLD